MKLVSPVRARSQCIKFKAVADTLENFQYTQRIIHTGQDYNFNLLGTFSKVSKIPKKIDVHLFGTDIVTKRIANVLEKARGEKSK